MINGDCFGRVFYPRYVSPMELFDSSILIFCALFLIFVFFRVRSQRKKNLEVVTSIDFTKVDVLMQPQNDELSHFNSDKLPFVNKNFSFLKFFLWGIGLMFGVVFFILLFK